MNWLEIAKEFGPYCGLVFFFLWRDSQREERRDAEIKQLNEFIQKTLIGLVEKSNEALNGPKQP
jgi:hypothetical protein